MYPRTHIMLLTEEELDALAIVEKILIELIDIGEVGEVSMDELCQYHEKIRENGNHCIGNVEFILDD